MHMKALERLISERGVDASKADSITRKLRESGHLPSGGRGANAPKIGPREAAIFLIAVAGSPKAIDAPMRVEKLVKLRAGSHGPTFLAAVESLLADPAQIENVVEVRVARTQRRATVVSEGGDVTRFSPATRNKTKTGRLSVEGILDGELICEVAWALGTESASDPEARDA